MFLVELHNGITITEREVTWKKLRDDKPIKMALLCNNGVIVGLAEMDEYWFSNQATAAQGEKGKLVAQILGGSKDGKITEFIQCVETGKASMYDKNNFNIETDHKNGRLQHEMAARFMGGFARLFRGFK